MQRLAENMFTPLPLGSIHSRRWLLAQLQTQAQGLTGHLDEFWPDVADSGWIGGRAESWERAPYWLDGLVPLAFLLQDERLIGKVHRWIDFILNHQQEDGWLGPVRDATYGYEHDPWPVSIILKALTQYQEATADPRVLPAMKRLLACLQTRITQQPLTSWAMMRSADLVLSVYWLHERTGEDWLLDLARLIQQQSYDWQAHFAHFAYQERQAQWSHEAHVVNNSMAIKQPAVWSRLTQHKQQRRASLEIIGLLDRFHGQVTGVFSGDEVLAGKNPSQGTELCAVVEYLFSLEVLLTILGEPALADRLERIAFNALPATFKPDMWAHQYDQQVNQVLCAVSEDRIYTTNGPEANLFGLAPNFGCCTANMHQGWPKYAAHLWMHTRDGGLAAISYAPCTVTTTVAGNVPVTLDVITDYPFAETIQLVVSVDRPARFPLVLHIPAWAEGATVTDANQESQPVQPGTFSRLEREWSGSVSLTLQLPMHVQAQTRYHQSIALERGPLVYALKIDEAWRQLRGEPPAADWEVFPTSPWNYALAVDRVSPEPSCRVLFHEFTSSPFASEQAPVSLNVQGKQIPAWTLERNAAGSLPESPVTSTQPLEALMLIPYGCTSLRVTEFPVLS